MALNLDEILKVALKGGASDIHLKSGLPPMFRVDGALVPLKNGERLMPEDMVKIAHSIMNEVQRARFEEKRECDLAYGIAGLGRFRVNVFQQRGTTGIVFRVIPFGVKTMEQLFLPKVIEKIALEQRGLILVTGTTGSGKSTTLASMIDHINTNRTCHIMTIEDPIEFLIRDRRSIVNQREIGVDTQTFSNALRAALRQDPDVILVGEMRDSETAEIGLRAAITGHMVLSTLHTRDAAGTPYRLLDMGVPPFMVASSLQAVVAQRLVRANCENCRDVHTATPQEMVWLAATAGAEAAAAGERTLRGRGCSQCNGTGLSGRAGVYEMLEMDTELAYAITASGGSDPTRFAQLARERLRGRTMAQHALALVRSGRLALAEAMRLASDLD
jgi:pilus retraction protein PilT